MTILTFRARSGEEDAVVALHEDWEHHRRQRANGYLSGQLLIDKGDPRSFIVITHYAHQAAAQAALCDPEHDAWYRRLASLAEGEPSRMDCRLAWQTGGLGSPYIEAGR